MKRTKIFILLSILLLAKVTFSQENHKLEDTTQISLPRFDVHIGAGWVNGARIGLRTHFSEHFSIEISFGIPVTHFIVGGEREERYSIGINWHKSSTSSMIISLICASKVNPNRSWRSSIPNNKLLSYLMVSLNIGYLYIINSNFTFFIRGGAFYDLVEDNINFNSSNFGGLNLDLGIGWSFDFNK